VRALLFGRGKFNNLNFVIENFPLDGVFIIESSNLNRTFLLKNVLIILNGFILIRGSKVLLGTIMWVGWIVVFYQCKWIGDIFVVELYMEKFFIIQREEWRGFSIFGFNRGCRGRGNYLFSKWIIITG
jgi:hypothetical protein